MAFQFADPDGERLDHFLVTQLPEFSRARLQGLIRDGHVLVNGVPAHKSGQRLEGEALVEVVVPPAEDSSLVPESIPLDILYEDKNVIVVNKPAGMVVHPSVGHGHGTLVNAVLAHAPTLEGVGGEVRPGLVHRLDKDTSGVIILAKNDSALLFLQKQFQDRHVEKVYQALVDGRPPTPEGRIDAPIGRDPRHRQRMAVTGEAKGRQGVSEYRTLEEFNDHTLLAVQIMTGRTHQIRVHLAFLGTPVTGDTVYGHKKDPLRLGRQFLHAWRLTLRLVPDGKELTFEAPLPIELTRSLETLRKY
ncbi:MAG: RluA family pseudouridine synthase [Anaerolineae bacterium]|nr:MAG: RluA family pseudouridine synthase [Anaerolineae bacterium]